MLARWNIDRIEQWQNKIVQIEVDAAEQDAHRATLLEDSGPADPPVDAGTGRPATGVAPIGAAVTGAGEIGGPATAAAETVTPASVTRATGRRGTGRTRRPDPDWPANRTSHRFLKALTPASCTEPYGPSSEGCPRTWPRSWPPTWSSPAS